MSWFPIKAIKQPDWLKENKRLKRSILAVAGLLCADILLYAVLIVPSARLLRDGEARYAELRKRRVEAVLFQKQKQELAGIIAGIPGQKDMPLLIKDLVQTARRLNLSVSAINYDIPKRSKEELSMLSFSFPVQGRYADVKRFIHDIETSDRLVGIQDLKLAEEKEILKLDLKLVTYVKGR